MKYRIIAIIATVFLIAISGLGTADVLPKPVPENQVFTTTSIVEGVGMVSESTSLVWNIGDAGLTALGEPRFDGNGKGLRFDGIAFGQHRRLDYGYPGTPWFI